MNDVFRFRTRSGREILLVPEHAIRSLEDRAWTSRDHALREHPSTRISIALARADAWSLTHDAVIVDLGIAPPPGRAVWGAGEDVFDWDQIPRLADLEGPPRAPSDAEPNTHRDAPGSAPSRGVAPFMPSSSDEPATSGDEPVLLRVELGAVGFTFLGVLTLPRAAAGRWHPWAALTALALHLRDHDGAAFVALGHHETGEPSDHSRLRAEALVHFIRDERQPWIAVAAKWGRVRDVQDFLAYLHHVRGWELPNAPITGDADDATAAAVLAFQRAYNQRVQAALDDDGVIGEQTLGAIFDVAREDLLLWLELYRVDPGALAGAMRASLACVDRFKPYRTMPTLPPHQAGRFVDLVIIPADEAAKVDLGKAPDGAGIYDAVSISTVPLDGIRAPRIGMALEIVLHDAKQAPVADAVYEVVVPGGAVYRGTLDAHGEARIEGLIEGRCRVRFPDLAIGGWALVDTTIV